MSAKPKISDELRANTAFEYVADLPPPARRLAVFYEYWRESEELQEIVKQFANETATKAGPSTVGRMVASNPNIFPLPLIAIISRCSGFPEQPFRVFAQQEEMQRIWLKSESLLGSPSPGSMPWKAAFVLRDHMMRAGCDELDFWEGEMSNNTTLHPISIPWGYTNEELVGLFRRVIKQLRPARFPEPAKAGRRGRTGDSAVRDMLNQLGALRLNRAGIGFDQGQHLTIYSNERGWKRAILRAQERITFATSRPLFFTQ